MSDTDIIDQLPVDQSLPTHDEINLINNIFKKEKTNIQKICAEFKDIIYIGIIYILFSIPYIDTLIHSLIPLSFTYPYILLLIKAILFMILYWVSKNIWLLT